MTERFKIGDIDNETFIMMPKSLFIADEYKHLSITAKVMYSMLRDRMSLSRRNGWVDENGDIFFYYTQDDLCEILNISRPTALKATKELIDANMVESIRQGQMKPNKLYLLKLKIFTSRSKEILHQELNSFTSRSKEILHHDVKNLYPNNTEDNNTDINDTEDNNNKVATPLVSFTKKGKRVDPFKEVENEELRNTLLDFEEMRKKMRAQMTDRAKELALKKLEDLAPSNPFMQVKIVEQSLVNGWKGFFPLKTDAVSRQQSNTSNLQDMRDGVYELLGIGGNTYDAGGE